MQPKLYIVAAISPGTSCQSADFIVATMAEEVAKSPKKKATKPKKPVNHPKYCEMIAEAIGILKERGGSSRQALLKYILKNFDVGKNETTVNQHLKLALRAGVKNATLKQSKGKGASGSFRLGENRKTEKKPKKPIATPKKAAAKPKKPDKKVKQPKKTAKKSPKKTKKPATKKAKKPAKKEKTPKKAAKKPAKKTKPKKAAKPKKK